MRLYVQSLIRHYVLHNKHLNVPFNIEEIVMSSTPYSRVILSVMCDIIIVIKNENTFRSLVLKKNSISFSMCQEPK